MSDSLWPRLTPQRKALFRSQGGPMASVPYTCFPIDPHSRFDPQPFRVLLWLPLHGHHRAACAAVGVLGRRGFAVESVVKQGPGCIAVCPAGSRHHARVSPQTRRGSSQSGRKPQWCPAGRSSPSQRTDLPGAHGTVRSHPSGCPCRRSRGQVVRGKP